MNFDLGGNHSGKVVVRIFGQSGGPTKSSTQCSRCYYYNFAARGVIETCGAAHGIVGC